MDATPKENLGPAVLGVAWAFLGMSLLVVIARIYIRACIIRRTGLDDYIVCFTLFLSMGNSVFLTVSTYWGLGQHVEVLLSDALRLMYTVKYVYLCEFFAILCPCFGRIAFAMMLLSLLPPTHFRGRLLYAIIISAFIIDVATISISFAQCKPIEAFWDGRSNPNCWPKEVQQYTGFFQGSFGSLVDLMLALFPISLFWNLQMEWKQKAALSSIMGLGVFAMVASIVKTVQLRAITATHDLTYEMAKLAISWTLEANFVLIAVSIPALRPILKSKKSNSVSCSKKNNSDILRSWKTPQARIQKAHDQRQFNPLHESNDGSQSSIGRNHPGSDSAGYQLSNIQAVRRGSTDTLVLDGIRKDISVSVTYG